MNLFFSKVIYYLLPARLILFNIKLYYSQLKLKKNINENVYFESIPNGKQSTVKFGHVSMSLISYFFLFDINNLNI